MDASEHGFGGVCGNRYFEVSYIQLLDAANDQKLDLFGNMFIAYRELLAALFAFHVFSNIAPASFIRINSDNTNTVGWLNKGRCSKKMGFLLLSAIAYYKYVGGLRVTAFYIKSSHNTSADLLSRGQTPRWLKQRGIKMNVNISAILKLVTNPVLHWKTNKIFGRRPEHV